MTLRIAFAAALLALHGCTHAPVVRSPDLVPVEAAGDYTHAASGHVFPLRLGEFRRASLFRSASDPRRVTVGYAGGPPECLTAVTMFMVPGPASAVEDEYARATAEVREAYSSAVLEREARHPRLASRFADYLVEDRRLHVIVEEARPGWILKYRVMFPAKCREAPLGVGAFVTMWLAAQPPPG